MSLHVPLWGGGVQFVVCRFLTCDFVLDLSLILRSRLLGHLSCLEAVPWQKTVHGFAADQYVEGVQV